jgi:uracil-DNA glycosylase family 4
MSQKELEIELDHINENFDILCDNVKKCVLCPRMCDSARILNRSVGNLKSDIMFIGEAPGRLGADSSGIPFHGDMSGHNFEDLLSFSNIDRNKIYVTNAVLCNPKDKKGNNSTPINQEIKNCSSFLKQQIELINPKIVVTLGAKALQALSHIHEHNLTLKESTRTSNTWFNRILIPCYHPGQRAMIHRSMANQRSDYQFIGDNLRSLSKRKNSYTNQKTNDFTSLIVEYILTNNDKIGYFALHKIFYLIEYNYFIKYNERLSSSYIVRQKDGPYCTDLHIRKLKNSISDLQTDYFKNGTIKLHKNYNKLFVNSLLNEYELDSKIQKIIDEVILKYGKMSMSKLKHSVYLTRPMRNMLYLEKEQNINMYNSPIEFTTKSIY